MEKNKGIIATIVNKTKDFIRSIKDRADTESNLITNTVKVATIYPDLRDDIYLAKEFVEFKNIKNMEVVEKILTSLEAAKENFSKEELSAYWYSIGYREGGLEELLNDCRLEFNKIKDNILEYKIDKLILQERDLLNMGQDPMKDEKFVKFQKEIEERIVKGEDIQAYNELNAMLEEDDETNIDILEKLEEEIQRDFAEIEAWGMNYEIEDVEIEDELEI